MELREDSPVVHRVLCKRDLLAKRDDAHEMIRPALVICGGGMRGAYGAGAMIALHRLGLGDCFDEVIGVSTGAAIASYFLAGEAQTRLGTSIYYQECTEGFIDFTRWPIANVNRIEQVMRSGPKQLDLDAIIKHRSHFFVGATEWETGVGRLIDVKDALPEPLAAIKASFAIAELYRRPVVVNGRRFIDGSVAMPFPAKKVIQRFGPTDMLVIANCSKENALRSPSWMNNLLAMIIMAGFSPGVKAQAATKPDSWRNSLAFAVRSGIHVGIIWGPDSVNRLTLDGARLRAAAEDGARNTLFAFGQPNLSFSLL